MALDLDAHAASLLAHTEIVRPEGDGPFPVVVQMHGCGGIQPMLTRYAETAKGAGVAALVVDSLAPRGIGRREAQLTVCTGLRLRGAERAGDLVAILHWLRGQPWADISRIAAAGWSHGAWSIMDALAGARDEPEAAELLAAIKLAVLIYPYAGPPSLTRGHGWGDHRPKVRALLGGKDAVVGVSFPKRALARLEADGLDVSTLLMPDATHAFDDENASDPRTHYRPDLAAEAHGFYAAALDSLSLKERG